MFSAALKCALELWSITLQRAKQRIRTLITVSSANAAASAESKHFRACYRTSAPEALACLSDSEASDSENVRKLSEAVTPSPRTDTLLQHPPLHHSTNRRESSQRARGRSAPLPR